MQHVFPHHAPELIFHAAAYKHVPLMESYPQEAVLNNIVTMRLLSELATEYAVKAFTLISTDKAVNPPSVMAAVKRLGELYIQAASQNSFGKHIKLRAVRFGSVLGSNGSVIPLFLRN
jgi:FlaA1/EpsC-like NDP-sugar epimerase